MWDAGSVRGWYGSAESARWRSEKEFGAPRPDFIRSLHEGGKGSFAPALVSLGAVVLGDGQCQFKIKWRASSAIDSGSEKVQQQRKIR